MQRAITIDRDSANGRYADILDAIEAIKTDYGSAVNAAAVLIRESPRFKVALQRAKSRKGNSSKRTT